MSNIAPNTGLPGNSRLGPVVVFGFFAFVCFVGLIVFGAVFTTLGYLLGAVATTVAASVTANWLSIRVFERGRLLDAGLWWTQNSLRNAALGLGIGAGSALLVTLLPVLVRVAELVPDPAKASGVSTALYISGLLLFGAVAEELMFRGYAFQVLARGFGASPTLAVTSVLFGLVHMGNLNFSGIALANTIGFGVILGLAMVRTGALWMAIGLHFGWNWVQPLAGVNLSGFNMGMTGYSLRWHLPELWSGGSYGPEGGLLTSAVVLGLIALLLFMPVRREDPPQAVTPAGEPPSEA